MPIEIIKHEQNVGFGGHMNEKLFDYMKEQGLRRYRAEKGIKDWSGKKCSSFIKNCIEIIGESAFSKANTFSFIASTPLSGGIQPCMEPICRAKRANSLAIFSALYADNVLIQDPFRKYVNVLDTYSIDKNWLIGDIEVLFEFEDLMKNDLMGIARSEMHFCKDCAKKAMMRQEQACDKRSIAEEILMSEYIHKVNFTVKKYGTDLFIETSGPEDLIEHGKTIIVPSKGSSIWTLLGGKVNERIETEEVKKGLIMFLIGPILNDLMSHDMYSDLYGYNLLTNRSVDFVVRSRIESNKDNIRSSSIMEGIRHTLPNIENVSLNDLINLRKDEEESLKVYRNSIDKILTNVSSGAESEEVISLFNSEVIPELNNLDMLFSKIKNDARKNAFRKAIVGTGFISIGLFSGLFPPDIGRIMGAIGGYQFVDAISEDISHLIGVPKDVQTSRYYFLWKANEMNRNTKLLKNRHTAE